MTQIRSIPIRLLAILLMLVAQLAIPGNRTEACADDHCGSAMACPDATVGEASSSDASDCTTPSCGDCGDAVSTADCDDDHGGDHPCESGHHASCSGRCGCCAIVIVDPGTSASELSSFLSAGFATLHTACIDTPDRAIEHPPSNR